MTLRDRHASLLLELDADLVALLNGILRETPPFALAVQEARVYDTVTRLKEAFGADVACLTLALTCPGIAAIKVPSFLCLLCRAFYQIDSPPEKTHSNQTVFLSRLQDQTAASKHDPYG